MKEPDVNESGGGKVADDNSSTTTDQLPPIISAPVLNNARYHQPSICYSRILLGEITPLLTTMRRAVPRWSSHHQEGEPYPLVVKLRDLQMTITKLSPDDQLDSNTFLDPFLSVIRSEDTTGPVTKSALAAVNRMLNYGLISPATSSASSAVESVAAAVTHARFVGTDPGADEVVLWEILTVLRTLILGPVGHLLTNESVCEILNSSFRICFETRLSELLRNCTEDTLRHMVQLLFARLPQFKDDPRWQGYTKRLKMQTGGEVKGKRSKGRLLKTTPTTLPAPTTPPPDHSTVETKLKDEIKLSESPQTETVAANTSPTESDGENAPVSIVDQQLSGDTASIDSGIVEAISAGGEALDISHTHLAPDLLRSVEQIQTPSNESDSTCIVDHKTPSEELAEVEGSQNSISSNDSKNISLDSPKKEEEKAKVCDKESKADEDKEDFINHQGVKFTQEEVIEGITLVPYGMPCVREVLRFLISLTCPTNDQNTPTMIHTALNLLAVAMEVGADHINKAPSLLSLIRDQLCHNLLMLLNPEVRPPIFMASLRVCALLFESLRNHLKFQLEMFLKKLSDLITSEAPTVSYSQKELALETVVQLWRIPGLITELFLNFDCDLYSANIFEDLTKVLSKNAFPMQGLYSNNLLSLEALLTVVDTINGHCPSQQRKKLHCKLEDNSNVSKSELSFPSVIAPVSSGYLLGLGLLGGFSPVTPILKSQTILLDDKEVCREHLLAIKEKKRLLAAGTDQFNAKPEKGILFLQDNSIIGTTNEDIAIFLKENPHLDKQIIGEYVCKKKNAGILAAFVKSFDFRTLRLDECLRIFLETFRMPGEAPVISYIIEHFSGHWHTSNNEPFEKEDAAFTLAYAVIMLNVDQHNQNAKKQNVPMTSDQFKVNLRGVNGGKDFDQDMLEDIYHAIKGDEIVMPAEQTGLVKETYMWKMLLRRGATKDGVYLLANNVISFDRDLFSICWGPTVASLSYVFDKSSDDIFIQKSIDGFKKCASIAARYGMSDVFDNLVVSLCKFTTLTISSNEQPEYVSVSFGGNNKAQLAACTVFKLVTSHGDILRDGWKNILELLLQLFRCRLLPSHLVESEDFIEPSGKVSIMQETPAATPRVESGLLSSLYSYIALGDAGAPRGTSPEDAELTEKARKCIIECHPEKLIDESAFLRCDSLNELLKAMMGAGDASNMTDPGMSSGIPMHSSVNLHSQINSCSQGQDEHSQAFLLELVVAVLIANKDRAGSVWGGVRDHIYSLLMGAAAAERNFLLERCVVAILRIAKVLLRRPELANPILQGLRMLLLLRPHILARVSLQIVAGIHEVLSVNADHIHDSNDWAVLFTLLECSGAGAKPPPMVNAENHDTTSDAGSISDSDLGSSSGLDSGHCTEPGYTSDSGEPTVVGTTGSVLSSPSSSVTPLASSPVTVQSTDTRTPHKSRAASPDSLQSPGGWILVGREGEIEPVAVRAVAVNEWDIVHQRQLGEHKAEALVRAVDALAFLVRERHITISSLPSAVQACRTFVEATLNGGKSEKKPSKDNVRSPTRRKAGSRRKEDKVPPPTKRPKSPVGSNAYDADESDSDDVPVTYQQVSEKLLDLMDTLHTCSGQIVGFTDTDGYGGTVPAVSLWHQSLCPLLQGIARYCCDTRTTIRNMAMTYLQRALLNHDLQSLSAGEWESCFNKVLFPLLAKLLQPLSCSSHAALEETRVRAATLVQKVYLRHLTPLLTLPTFTALWLTILDFMDKYLHLYRSDHLSDAIPEILKNMLLVMETTQVFHTTEGFTKLWSITWDRIDAFLPDFRHDLFKSHPPSEIHRIEVSPSDGTSPNQDTTTSTSISFSVHSIPSPTSSISISSPTPTPTPTPTPICTNTTVQTTPTMSVPNLTSPSLLSNIQEHHQSLESPFYTPYIHPVTPEVPSSIQPSCEPVPMQTTTTTTSSSAFQSACNVTDTSEGFSTSALRNQYADRLSLSQETLPTSYGKSVILQPPRPSLLPPMTPSSPSLVTPSSQQTIEESTHTVSTSPIVPDSSVVPTSTTPPATSLFSLSLPSFLNPFAVESDTESDEADQPPEKYTNQPPETNTILETQNTTPTAVTSPYRPASILFSQSTAEEYSLTPSAFNLALNPSGLPSTIITSRQSPTHSSNCTTSDASSLGERMSYPSVVGSPSCIGSNSPGFGSTAVPLLLSSSVLQPPTSLTFIPTTPQQVTNLDVQREISEEIP